MCVLIVSWIYECHAWLWSVSSLEKKKIIDVLRSCIVMLGEQTSRKIEAIYLLCVKQIATLWNIVTVVLQIQSNWIFKYTSCNFPLAFFREVSLWVTRNVGHAWLRVLQRKINLVVHRPQLLWNSTIDNKSNACKNEYHQVELFCIFAIKMMIGTDDRGLRGS